LATPHEPATMLSFRPPVHAASPRTAWTAKRRWPVTIGSSARSRLIKKRFLARSWRN